MFINEGGGTRKRIDNNSSSDESDRANILQLVVQQPVTLHSDNWGDNSMIGDTP